MRDADESAGIGGTLCNLRAGFIGRAGGKIERQSSGHDVPQFAHGGCGRVEFSPQKGGEFVAAEFARVGHGPVVMADEMFG